MPALFEETSSKQTQAFLPLLFLTDWYSPSLASNYLASPLHRWLLPHWLPIIWASSLHRWGSLVAQLVKNPCAMWETWVRSLGWEDPLEKGKATHSGILAWRIPWTVRSWGRKESDTTE